MKRKKLTIIFALIIALILFMSACQSGSPADDGVSSGEGSKVVGTNPKTGATVGEAPKLELSVSEKETEEGWLALTDIGFKYKFPKAWMDHIDYLDPYVKGDPNDEGAALYRCLYYDFMETALIERALQIVNDDTLSKEDKFERMSMEVWPNAIKLLGVQLYRRTAFDKAKSIEELTNLPNNRVLAKDSDLVHIVSWANVEAGKDLPRTDRMYFEELIGAVDELVESIQVARPVISADSLDEIKNWKFSSVDLDGQPVDESIFSEAKLTMVNIWATWCGPCRVEIPDIGSLAKNEFKAIDVQVLGIVADINLDEEHEFELATAKQILSDAGASYLNIKTNQKNMNDSLFKFVQVYPTTFFMDKNGNVVGSIILGARSKDEFLEEVQSRLAMLND